MVVLPLPERGSQDYQSLSEYVVENIPDENFILIAESFSGGIAANLSCRKIPNLIGIIYVASFLSAPKRIIASIVSLLPIRAIALLPVSDIMHRLFCLGWGAGKRELNLFKRAIKSVSDNSLKSRLGGIAEYKYTGFKSLVPVS